MKLRAVLGDLAAREADAIGRVVLVRRRRVLADELGLLAAAGPAAADAFDELLALARAGGAGAGLAAGQAVSTTAGDLPARWLVHVAVPRYLPQRQDEFRLAAAYRAMLEVADGLGARTLALTPFGLTLPYWPLDTATRVALSTLRNTPCRVREATLVVRTTGALDVLAEALARR